MDLVNSGVASGRCLRNQERWVSLRSTHPTWTVFWIEARLRTAIPIDHAFAAAAGAFFAARGAGRAARGVANAARGALSAARGVESAGDGAFCADGRVESAASHALSADGRAKRAARDAFCAARGEKSVMFHAPGNAQSRSGSGFSGGTGLQDRASDRWRRLPTKEPEEISV